MPKPPAKPPAKQKAASRQLSVTIDDELWPLAVAKADDLGITGPTEKAKVEAWVTFTTHNRLSGRGGVRPGSGTPATIHATESIMYRLPEPLHKRTKAAIAVRSQRRGDQPLAPHGDQPPAKPPANQPRLQRRAGRQGGPLPRPGRLRPATR